MNKNENSFIWMPLIGFDRDQKDKGVGEFIENARFTPKGVSVFLFHSDIVNEHEDMSREFVLHPDNCAYYGASCNEIRERQPWTNYDLRTLAGELKARDIEAYLGIMGVYLEDTRHKEWESDHPELMSFGEGGRMNLNVLKRFKDGTYYEDFFVDKITRALTDYGFSGLHVSDFFCPPEHTISDGDFSTDLLLQFKENAAVSFPADIEARLGFDDQDDINKRKEYIWEKLRLEWIAFYSDRWYRFWHKICTALKKLGKKVMINNAWCSDPTEALYRYGIDYRRLIDAGVDYIVCETVAEGIELVSKRGDCFNRFMSMSQLVSAYISPEHTISLLGVKDSTEEWDIIHHATPRLERDIFRLSSLYLNKKKLIRANSALMVCLGDGLTSEDWDMINERTDIGYEIDYDKIYGTSIVWSNDSVEAFVRDYAASRRPSQHKTVYELENRQASFGAVIAANDLDHTDSALFVPCFDLLPEDAQKKVLAYKKAPVIALCGEGARIDGAELVIEDTNAVYRQTAYVFNAQGIDTKRISEFFECYPEKVTEKTFYDHSFFTTLMPFNDMSEAFMQSLVYILRECDTSPLTAETQIFTAKITDKKYRVYVYNPKNVYFTYKITSKCKIDTVSIITRYPVISPHLFVNRRQLADMSATLGSKYESMHKYDPLPEAPDGFEAKVTPCGVSVFDVTLL